MDTLIGLAQVMVPDLKRPAKTREDVVQGNTTEFKICKTAGGKGYYPFSNRQAKKAFDDRVKGDYAKALTDMCDFVKKFIWVRGSGKNECWDKTTDIRADFADALEGNKVIVSSAETDFAKFVRKIKASDWLAGSVWNFFHLSGAS